jgi:hypothetical protein
MEEINDASLFLFYFLNKGGRHCPPFDSRKKNINSPSIVL